MKKPPKKAPGDQGLFRKPPLKHVQTLSLEVADLPHGNKRILAKSLFTV
jgi:hypothetical protein